MTVWESRGLVKPSSSPRSTNTITSTMSATRLHPALLVDRRRLGR
jgi:hypothetical protein